jgi:hypothetical protein
LAFCLGLITLYKHDEEFRKSIGLVKKLPFLHPNDIVKGFKAVGTRIAELFDVEERSAYLPSLEKFLRYVWKYYVRDEALYQRDRWSVH